MTTRPAIERFVRGLRRRHWWWQLAQALTTHALVGGVALALVDLLAPAWLWWGIVVLAGWLTIVGVRHGRVRRLPLGAADHALGLGDRLRTYVGLREPEREPFGEWLREDLETRLAALPPEAPRRIWHRPLGALRYMVPVLVLLLLLRLFAPPLPPSDPDEGPPMAQNGNGEGEGGGGGGEQPDSGPQESEPDPQEEQAPDEQPPDPPPQTGPEPPEPAPQVEEPPKPLLDKPATDQFVVPDFVDEGETRREMANVAIVDQGQGGTPPPAPQPRGAQQSSEFPVTPDDYDKAREEALRARHVPAAERPFVRRYFDALAKALR